MLVCSTSAHNQNRDYVILIMYTQLNVITCLKCKIELIQIFNKIVFIYLQNHKMSKIWPHP
jgi:hypothetical protein